MRFMPRTFMRYATQEQGVGYNKIEAAGRLFSQAKRIDFLPLSGSTGRGLIVCLD